jgi:hypothetical protein
MAAITSSDDRLAQIGAEQSLLARSIYGAPQGDSAIIRGRVETVFDAERFSYVAGDTVRVDIASRTHCLDTSRSYFHFKIKYHKLSDGAAIANANITVDELAPQGVAPVFSYVALNGTTMGANRELQGFAGNEFHRGRPRNAVMNGTAMEPASFRTYTTNVAATPAFDNQGQDVGTGNTLGRRRWIRKDGDTQNLVESMRWLTRKGTVLEAISNYNQLARTRQTTQWTEEEKDDKGLLTGHGAYSVLPYVGTSVVTTKTIGDEGSNPQAPYNYCGRQHFYAGRERGAVAVANDVQLQEAHFQLDLECSGVWRFAQFLPIYALEGLRLEILLAPFSSAFKGALIPFEDNSFQQVGSYIITDFKLVAEMVELSAAMKIAIENVIQRGGMPLFIPTWHVTTVSPGNGVNINIRIQERLSHATTVWWWAQALQVNSAVIDQGFSDIFDHQHMRPTSVQLRIGTVAIPDQPIATPDSANWRLLDLPLYNMFSKTVGTFGPAAKSSLPVYKHWSARKTEQIANADAAGGAAGDLAWRAAMDNFSYYTLGASLQTSPGIDGSGTILGDVADLEIKMQLAFALEGIGLAPNSRLVFVAIHYDRMLLIRDGGAVDVTS